MTYSDFFWLLVWALMALTDWPTRALQTTARLVLRARARWRERARRRAFAQDLDRRQLVAVAQAFGRRPVRIVDTVITQVCPDRRGTGETQPVP